MNNKLELTWYGKENEIKLEPRILIEDKGKSYRREEDNLSGDEPIYDNMLIHGDNLLALKALESDYTGKVKCIYIDPPYNTGSAFSTYDDNLEHSTWLSLMKPRLEILRKLLADDGSIWISIDADECHYLKVLCDEIFGRRNFIDEIVWQRAFSPINLKKTLSRSHDSVLVYAKNLIPEFEFNKLPRSDEALARYKNIDNDPRGPWSSSDLSVGPAVKENIYPIVTPSGRKVLPPEGYSWRLSKERFEEYKQDNRIWFGPSGNSVPRIKRFISEVKGGVVSVTWWTRDEVGDNQEAKREIKALFDDNVFDTPKPERLIKRILELATNPGDLVLDSFLGSGTTAAVAHKMHRRWIGIELGESAYIHCKVRLDKVIDGEDKGGITDAVGWIEGGGYRFYELAPTLIKEDKFGQPIINPEYSPEMLAAAVAKHEGYKYSPSTDCYWKQSISEDHSYLYVTTQHLSEDIISNILVDLADNETLLIVCKSYDSRILADSDRRISIKKIPQSLLKSCEFGTDNYNLNIINPPEYEEDED